MMNTHSNTSYRRAQKALCLLLAATTLGWTPVFASGSSDQKKPSKNTKPEAIYPKLVIGPGDLLTIFVYGENGVVAAGGGGAANTLGSFDQLPTDYQVDSDGEIFFPFLGRVKMLALTPAEASEKIARLLSKPRKVTVLIKESNTYWVSVLGNVARPGRYQIVGHPTLLSTLAQAGGPLPDTDMGGTILIHDNLKTRLDLNKYLTGTGTMENDPYVYPGDTLMVQRSPWPSFGEWAIVASILASGAVVTVELSNLRH